MNVALTRAKSSLFVLGHAPTLERSDDTWRGIISDAKSRNCLLDVDVSYFTSPTSTNKVVPSAVKTSKPQSKPQSKTAPPVPLDLVTPRELKSLAKNTVPESSTQLKEAPASSVSLPSLPSIRDPPKIDEVKAGQKRPAPDDQSNEPPQYIPKTQDGGQIKSRPPPKKRPKAGPSLFIPKPKRP